jgi:hypothetical protein
VADGGVKICRKDDETSRREFLEACGVLLTAPSKIKVAAEDDDVEVSPLEETKGGGGGAALVVDEERAVGKVSLDVYKRYCNRLVFLLLTRPVASAGGLRVLVYIGIIQSLWQGAQVMSDVVLSFWSSQPQEAQQAALATNLNSYVALAMAASALVGARVVLISRMSVSASKRLFLDMTTSIMRAPLRFFV